MREVVAVASKDRRRDGLRFDLAPAETALASREYAGDSYELVLRRRLKRVDGYDAVLLTAAKSPRPDDQGTRGSTFVALCVTRDRAETARNKPSNAVRG